MLVYCDGTFLPAADARIPLFDEGYLFGEGVFTTLRLYRGRPYRLSANLDRLAAHAGELAVDCRFEPAMIEEILSRLVTANSFTETDCRARLTLSRRGHAPTSPAAPPHSGQLIDQPHVPEATFSVFLSELPVELRSWQTKGIGIITAPKDLVRGGVPHLKSLNYLSSRLALRAAEAVDCHEALFCDHSGNVLEGAISNVFHVLGQQITTPPADLPLLAGLTRERVLELAGAETLTVAQQTFTTSELLDADEVFLTNAVREVVPVVALDGQTLGGGKPGPITRQLQKKFGQDVCAALAE